MTDIDKPNKSWWSSWPGKLVLTTVLSGALSLWTYWRFSSTFNVADGLFGVPIGIRHIVTVVVWAVLVAAFLCLIERNDWYKSIFKTLSLSMSASLVITTSFVLFMQIFGMFVDHIMH
jgi:hypothetical protein